MGIGANDAANAFATSVGAKTLKLWHALIICAIFEFSGAVFMGSHVGETVRKGITSEKNFAADPEKLMLGMFCVCISVTFWLALATKLALPVSTTHSAIGGIIGMTIVAEGWGAVKWEKVGMVVASWFISPGLAMLMSSSFYLFVRFALLQVYPCCRDKKKNPKCASKWCSPYFRTLMFYPFLVAFCFGVQTFFIIYKGSPQLKLKNTPLWLALLVALGVGAVGGVISIALIPALKYCAEWTHNEEQRAKLDLLIRSAEEGVVVGSGETDGLLEGDGSDKAAAAFPTSIEMAQVNSSTSLVDMEKNAATSSQGSPGGAREADGESEEGASAAPATKESGEATPENSEGGAPATGPGTPVAKPATDSEEGGVDVVDVAFAEAAPAKAAVSAAAPAPAAPVDSEFVAWHPVTGDSHAAMVAKRDAADAQLAPHFLHKVDVFETSTEANAAKLALKVRDGVDCVLGKGLDMDIELLHSIFPLDVANVHDVVGDKQGVEDIHANLERFDPKAEATFKFLQVLTACAAAFGHGANDVANAISPFAAVYSIYVDESVSKKVDMPIWILVMGGVGIVVGLALWGHIIIRAIGVELVALTPSRGFSIELASASVGELSFMYRYISRESCSQFDSLPLTSLTTSVVLASRLGWPVSSTHCQVGAEVGVGIMDGLWPRKDPITGVRKCTICKAVNWKQLVGVFLGWIVTIVIAGGTSAAIFSMLYFSPSSDGAGK